MPPKLGAIKDFMSWEGSKSVQGPAGLAVELSFVKDYLRINGEIEDSLLEFIINSASKLIENYLQISLITQTWVLSRDNFDHRVGASRERYQQDGVIEATKNYVYNENEYIYLPMGRVRSITSLVTYNEGNIPTTFSASSYSLDNTNDKSRLVLNDQETWPTNLRDNSAVEITYVAGFGDSSASVPNDIKLAICAIAFNVYEYRCAPTINSTVASMLSKYKVFSLG